MAEKKEHRIVPIAATVVIELCVGVVYIWSIFQTGVSSYLFNGDNAKASLTYSLALFMISVGGVIGGKLGSKYSIRVVVTSGGIMLALGFLLSSFVTPNFPYLIWLTFGIMGGMGMGFCYSPAIGCAQKWAPDKKGLVSGVIVAALGISGLIATPIAEKLITLFGKDATQGMGELMTFRVIGILFLVVCTIASIFIVNPSEEFSKKYASKAVNAGASQKVNEVNYSPKEVLRMPSFYILTIALMLSTMSGLMMIGFAKPIAVAKGLGAVAAVGVITISVFNATGRLVWGSLSDKLGRTRIIIMLLIVTSVMSTLLNMANGYAIFGLIAVIGLCYGGFLSVYPSLTADLFGAKNFATNYGMVLFGFGIAALASSYIAGYFKNIAKDDIRLMAPAFMIASACSLVSVVLILIIDRKIKKNKMAA